MSTIEVYSAILPAAVTMVAFAIAFANIPESRGGFLDLTPLFGCFLFLLALVASLAAWLVWALVA